MAATPDARTPSRSSSPRASVQAFRCAQCGATVPPEAFGTRQRNHCPHCLHSLHVDLAVGDRRSLCHGLMEPIGAWVRTGGEVSVLHRCRRCGILRSNRIAGDDDLAPLNVLQENLASALSQAQGPASRSCPEPAPRTTLGP